ncbi:pyridoxal 5'-phosphate synthase [Trinickia diaoshuihuensis]|jgi:pyridoxamine 5'-phosphate oxidase|uniref:pyridoxal 5'-phosphate synthase n=1 Tax=Trinickia diaoshuihuensis TaxID=2292265 RepID=UPI000E24CF6D|nr:pyridoxal 5'-phosphate synthase [Trinickia diaoshuihuensis]
MQTIDETVGNESIFNDSPENPITAVRSWYADAIARNVSEPGAMAVATVSAQGVPSSRTIQILELRDEGFVFATHAQSPKGRDIAATGWASGVWYWRETKRQVIVTGKVTPLADHESDALWASRPHESHAMSTVSRQSAPLEDEHALAEQIEMASKSDTLVRPDGWLGYILRPSAVEFWEFSPDRIYKRLRYEESGGAWSNHRLQP